jgi:hypothetical protein
MRKCELLQVAALHAVEPQRSRLLERARHFHDRSTEELERRPTRTLCRPVVLLLSNGYSRSFFEQPLPSPVACAAAVPDLPPARFVPQKLRAKRRLKTLMLWTLGAALLAAVLISC